MADVDEYDGPFYSRLGERQRAVNGSDRRRRRLRGPRHESAVEGEDAGVADAEGGVDGDGDGGDLQGDVSTSLEAVVGVKRLRTDKFTTMEEVSGSGTGTQASSTVRGTRGAGRRQRGADTTWLLTGGSPGGLEDPSVIPSFVGHIAC
ncbi:hypothetical protein RND81_09G108600 [Saponaria officinalis]|uniref:Uncharacterized protein n=1 Tax=Saponaria officinalis TaxID=3572 RepID=A0AAW1IJA7_SAPOF